MKKSDTISATTRAAILSAILVCMVAVLFCSPVELSRAAKAQQGCTPISNPFELVPQQFSKNAPPKDVNGFLLNPQWAWQVNCPVQMDGGIPTPTLENFPDSIDPNLCNEYKFTACSNNQTAFDPVGICPMCNLGRRRKNRELGHVNWFTVTYTGDVCFHNTSYPDMDYTFSLRPRMGAGLTRWNHPSKPDRSGKPVDPKVLPQAIHVEFDSRETVNLFQSDIWKKFRHDASPCRWWDFRHSCDIDAAMALISLRRAVVIGLMGLDSEHDIYSESHPVYAMAIEVNANPHNNTWIVFARNTGTEGNCSSQEHPLIWPSDGGRLMQSLKLLIPPPVGVKVNEVSTRATQFFSNNGSCPELGYYNNDEYSEDNEGVLITFNLEPCTEGGDCNPLVEGEIHLDWTFQRAQSNAQLAARSTDRCLSLAKEEKEEESKKYKDPSPAQAVRLLQLLADERAAGTSSMSPCQSGVGPIPRVQVTTQQKNVQTENILRSRARAGTHIEDVKKHYKKISDILFPN